MSRGHCPIVQGRFRLLLNLISFIRGSDHVLAYSRNPRLNIFTEAETVVSVPGNTRNKRVTSMSQSRIWDHASNMLIQSSIRERRD